MAAEMGAHAVDLVGEPLHILALRMPLRPFLRRSAWEGPLRGFCCHY